MCQRDIIATRRSARLRTLSNLDAVAEKTFDKFILDLPGWTEEQLGILRYSFMLAQRYAEAPQGWLLFQGSLGCGKTHLAAAIANYQLVQGMQVMFVTAPDLLDHLRGAFGPSSEIDYDDLFERIRNTDLLVLDDLGAESTTPWAQEKLYQLINHRYLNQFRTIITTNSRLDEIDPRIRSRLVDRNLTRIINMNLPDYRRTDATNDQWLSNLGLYGEMVFESFDLRQNALPEEERRNLQRALETAREYAEQPEGWLVFTGPHGSGKTHLAAAIANYRKRLGETVLFVTASDLLDYLRAAFNPSTTLSLDKRFDELRSAPLLIIDHLDLRSASTWALEKIRQISDYRYLAKLPTVFTSPHPLEEIDPMLRSRLLDSRCCRVFAILAPDYMGGATRTRRQFR